MNKPILQQMAANIKSLSTPQAKGHQAHLLCAALVALLITRGEGN